MAKLALLLTVLTPALADSVEWTSSAQCFPSSEQFKYGGATIFHGAGGPPKIVLEIQNWMTHQLNTRVAEILLREKLGFDVEVRYFDDATQNSYHAYERLQERKVDLNVELWPIYYQTLRDELMQSDKFALGYLTGFTAKMGFYIPKQNVGVSARSAECVPI